MTIRAWLGNLTATAATFGASWGGAVWYWRAGNRLPGTGDLVLYLLVLPAGLLLAAWGLRALWRRAAARRENPAAPAAADDAGTAAHAAAAPGPALAILGAAVRTPHGDSIEALQAALAEGKARPALDRELVDELGYPLLAARVNGVDTGAVRQALGRMPGLLDAGDDYWRALALGAAVAAELGAQLALHPALPEHTSRIDPRQPSPLPMLSLHAAWPSGWSTAQREAAGACFLSQLAAAGWPSERIALAPAPEPSEDAAALLDTMLAQARPDTLAVLLASASELDAGRIDELAGTGLLLTARHPQGRVPGEGAAALLLAGSAQAALLGPELPALAQLRAFAGARRGESADTARQPDPALLDGLCTRALDGAACTPEQVALVAADADHRASRVMELMPLMSARLPQLDPAADLARVGEACGACAPVPFVATLALAAGAALERQAPVLCVGNLDPWRRGVAVVAPA